MTAECVTDLMVRGTVFVAVTAAGVVEREFRRGGSGGLAVPV